MINDFGGFGILGQLYFDELQDECLSPERVLLKMKLPPYVHISESVVTCIYWRTVLICTRLLELQ